MKAHYLPVCYLKGFVDPTSVGPSRTPHVWVRSPTTGAWKAKAPQSVAKRPDYYAVTRADGTKDTWRENVLAEQESLVAPILRRVPQGQSLGPDEAAALVLFACTMLLRSPVVHDDVDHGVLLPKLRELVEPSWKRFRESAETLQASLEACAQDTGDRRVLSLRAEDFDPKKYQLHLNREFVVDSAFAVGRGVI